MKLQEVMDLEAGIVKDLIIRHNSGDNEASKILLEFCRGKSKDIDDWKKNKVADGSYKSKKAKPNAQT